MTGAPSNPNEISWDEDRIGAWGQALAEARRSGHIVDLALEKIASIDEADAVQVEACEALEEPFKGFTTLRLNAHATNGQPPLVCSPLALERVVDPAVPFEIPRGLLGLRCALLFIVGSPLPPTAPLTRREAIESMIRCYYAVELLGRRVPGSVPLNIRTATADFGLHVATFRGPTVERWSELLSTKKPISERIDGNIIQEFDLATFVDDATRSLVQLGVELDRRRRQLSIGDMVSVGSTLPALQVLPGQTVRVDFAGLSAIEIMLT